MGSKYELIYINPFEDARGSLKKIVMKSKIDVGIEEVYLLYTNQGAVRGNHFHKETVEYFTVVSGEVTVALQDADTGGIERLTMSAGDNLVLKVPAYTAHAFKNEAKQPLAMLAVSSREFNAADNDTFPMSVLK